MGTPLTQDLQRTGDLSWEDRLRRSSARGRLTLNPEYQELKFRLHRRLLDKINLEALASIENEKVRVEVRNALMLLMDEESTLLSSLERQQICEEVLDEVFGLGPLEPLLQDPTISDILVNTHRQVYIERKGQLELTSVTFKDDHRLLRIIDKIVSQVGRRVDESSPMVDARLSDGSRVNAIIPPLAVDGPILSIRRFDTDKLMPDDMVAKKSITPAILDILKGSVTSKLNIIISGGTGSGKTTMLNALSVYISPTERVVTIEDAAELQLKQPHVVRLETRPPNLEGEGAVRQRELLINALRMRPDRIVIGECRGEEALDMLQAMNTGHDGSMTTIHANTPRDVISRLEVMVNLASSNLPVTAIRSQIAAAVDLIVQVERLSDGTRRCRSLTEVTTMEGDMVMLQDLFVFEKLGVSSEGKVIPSNPTDVGILQRRLLSAGIRSQHGLTVLYGLKGSLAVLLILLSIGFIFGFELQSDLSIFQILAAGALGWLGPNVVLNRLATKRKKAIKKGLPNALDMLVICVESGLGLDQALMQVSKELEIAHPEITDELAVMNLELRAGKRRSEALHNFGERTDVDEAKRMVSVLIQADRFGTSISQTLRNFSDYMRVQMRQEVEEKAAKIGVKLVFPIFFFILPSLFVVTVGPIVVKVVRDFLPGLHSQ